MDLFWQNVKKGDDARHARQTEPEGIERICDIPYIDDGDRYHMLDVYYPEKTEKLPVIIDVHGGGWMYGDKELNKIYCLNLAKRGFTVFNISYRLCPSVTVIEQIQDVMQALDWIQNNYKNYPCTDNIMLTGDSAGGMLAAFSACLVSSAKLRAVFDTVNCSMKLDTLLLTSPCAYMNVGGAMGKYTKLFWGDYKNKEYKDFMNFDSLLPYAKLPPVFLITSSGDVLALKQTRKANDDLQRFGFTAKLVDVPKFEGVNLPHVFSVLEPESKAGNWIIDKAITYYRNNIK